LEIISYFSRLDKPKARSAEERRSRGEFTSAPRHLCTEGGAEEIGSWGVREQGSWGAWERRSIGE